MRRALVILPLAVMATGCIEFEVTVHVKTNGSGRIVERIRYDTKALAPVFDMMQGLASGQGGRSTPITKRPWHFDRKELAARAADRGKGVELIEAEAGSTGARKGWDATYAFTDVTKLRLDFEGSGPAPGSPSQKGREAIRFDFTKGTPAMLVVHQPPPDTDDAKAPIPPDPEQLAQVKPLLEHLRVRLQIVVDGKIVSTNAKHVNGSAVTLMDLAFDRLENRDAAVESLVATQSIETLAKIDGVQVELQPRVTVKFK